VFLTGTRKRISGEKVEQDQKVKTKEWKFNSGTNGKKLTEYSPRHEPSVYAKRQWGELEHIEREVKILKVDRGGGKSD